MVDYSDEVGGMYVNEEGDENVVEGVSLIFHDGDSTGHYYRMESIDEEIKVLTRGGYVSNFMHVVNEDVTGAGMRTYLDTLQEYDFFRDEEIPRLDFTSEEVEEEIEDLVDRFLED